MRKFNVNVNGKTYVVDVEEMGEGTAPVAVAPVAATPAPAPKKVVAGGSVVKAPMPGNILKLVASEGATVKKGDKLLVLEAMKMENDILANADGVVSFMVKQGDTVDTNAALASIK